MKTQDQILEAIRNGKSSEAIDGRDFARLADFFPTRDWHLFGFSLKADAIAPEPKEWTHENVLAQLQKDLAFAFEKALDERGISASCMYQVVKMWMWVLDDPLQYHSDYAPYGLPLLRAVAASHNLPDPSGAAP